jgi:MYXO-CTERM domain-containing protein
MKLPRTLLPWFTAVALFSVTCRAQIVISVSDRVSTTPGADNGLNGFYWQRPVNSILVDGNSVPADSISNQIDSFGAPTGSFVAHQFVFGGNDLTEVNGAFGGGPWLGPDAGTFTGSTTNNLDDGAFRFLGFLFVPTAGTLNFGLTSDDGSRIRIGSVDVLGGLNDGTHGNVTNNMDVIFASAGLYPFQVDYFNGDWTNDGNNHTGNPDPSTRGGATLQILESGAPIDETSLYRNVPEASGLLLGLAGLGTILALRRREG